MSRNDIKAFGKVNTGYQFSNWRKENGNMDYCAKESTLNDYTPEVCARQETVKTRLEAIEKMLYEASMTQKQIIEGLTGARNDENGDKREERCMDDTLVTIQVLAEMCMASANKINVLLF